MNYVLSFCKITGASKIFSRNFYLPLLKPQTPKDALRTFRITGKWLISAKRQHYIPVLLNHTQKRPKHSKDFGKVEHKRDKKRVYLIPILDPENNENHKILDDILSSKQGEGCYVYTIDNKNYNLVISGTLELAIRDGEVVDVLISQRNDKIVVKLRDLKKIPIEVASFNGDDDILYKGEGATTIDAEKFHHHGKFTMSLAQVFEDKERQEEEWEKELERLLKKRKRQHGEGTKEWNEMVKACTANMDWKLFEVEAKKIIEYIEEPVVEIHIGMEVDDLENTKYVEDIIAKNDALNQLPNMKDIPEIINCLGSGVMCEMEAEFDDDNDKNDNDDDVELELPPKKITRRLSGVKVTLSSGKECFITGQMVRTDEGDVFVPGQTIENEFGSEYTPGITILMDNKPKLITGLIVGQEDNTKPMFVPTESTITEDGQLVFSQTKEERVKYKPRKAPKVRRRRRRANEEKLGDDSVINEEFEEEEFEEEEEEIEERLRNNKDKKKAKKHRKKKLVLVNGVMEEQINGVYETDGEESSGFESDSDTELKEENMDVNTCEIPEDNRVSEPEKVDDVLQDIESVETNTESTEKCLSEGQVSEDAEDLILKQHLWELEMERLRIKAIDDKILEIIESLEMKKSELLEKLEELRKLAVDKSNNPVSIAGINDATEIASRFTENKQHVHVISEILLTVMRRVITFSDKNNINIENIHNHNLIYNQAEADSNCPNGTEKLKIVLKTAMVAANNIFKNRPKDEVSALRAIGAVLEIGLRDKNGLIGDLCGIMEEPVNRSELCALLLAELIQKPAKNKVKILKSVINDHENCTKDYVDTIDKLSEILNREGNIMVPAFKKIAKNNPKLVSKVIELAKNNFGLIKNERNAVEELQNSVANAVNAIAEINLKDVVQNNSDVTDIKELKDESIGFLRILGYDDVADKIQNLPVSAGLLQKCDRSTHKALIRVMVLRSLAENDYGLKAALKEIRKNPDFGKTNPRIRQLIRESAVLLSSTQPVKTSKEISAKLLEDRNVLALEDFLIQKGGLEQPVLVSKKGKQVVVPRESAKDVLSGKIPYKLVDEDGVTNIKPVRMYSSFRLNSDYDKKIKDYSPNGTTDRFMEKKLDKSSDAWADVPKYDVRNRTLLRKMSGFNHRMVA